MEKVLLSIGFDFPGHQNLIKKFVSDESLLDADIAVISFDLGEYILGPAGFDGRRLMSKADSVELKRTFEHWRREIDVALEHGKTIFVVCRKFIQFSFDFGHVSNGRKITYPSDNYQFVPIELGDFISTSGSALRFKGTVAFTEFWSQFEGLLHYESYLHTSDGQPVFVTKSGEMLVGGVWPVKRGHLVLLPSIRNQINLGNAANLEKFTADQEKLGKRLLKALFGIDKALRFGGEKTPAPDWANNTNYSLPPETVLINRIGEIEQELAGLEIKRRGLKDELSDVAVIRDLLFEKGKPLEKAIMRALILIGYHAVGYDDGNLEFDHVITSPEGERFVGEAEGKDTSAINIEKLRQLASNIQEDLQREDVDEPAQGILFGNGFRLVNPADRSEQFTEKCLRTAISLQYTLVRCTDLFVVARYIQATGDTNFSKICREAISACRNGVVEFPQLPAK